MNARILLCPMVLIICCAWATTQAADTVLITELMAVNDGTVRDENGDAEDWIELHNAGTNVVNLDGWFLTDKVAQPTQWRFPATNLAPNAYLIVFASGKDRRVPGATLHTNFKLNDNGEALVLYRPDLSVASAYAPFFPPQVSGVSYGLVVAPTTTNLLTSGATARVRVPTDGSLGATWTTPAFNDASWTALPTGVGFEAPPFVSVTLASSVAEFSGAQGQNNWSYGYWNRGTDGDGVYAANEFVAFPNGGGGWSAGNFWTGSTWDWFAGDPPFTQLTSQGGRPSGENGGALPDHWAVRRYVNEVEGKITVSGSLTHTSDWVYVTYTGQAGTALLYLYLLGAGEGYIDDIKLVAGFTPEAGANLLGNGDFESGSLSPWQVGSTLNMINSTVTTAVKHSGTRSLRLVATGPGSTQNNSIWQAPTTTAGQTYTLSYWFLPVTNSPTAVVRASGNWLYTEPTVDGENVGDGVVARIFVDGAEVFQQTAFISSQNYSVTVPALLGSKVDLAIDSGPGSDDTADATIFTATVATADPAYQIVADSAADWSMTGAQGERNWFYGYYSKGADPDATYQTTNFLAFPRNGSPHGSNNFWDGQEWDWPSGDPPFDKIGQYWMIPNGNNSTGGEQWVIRRWISEVAGTIDMQWAAFKELPDQNNAGGGGVIVRAFHKGVPIGTLSVKGGDTVGVSGNIAINNVAVGDAIDIALDPTNVGNVDQFEPFPAGPHDDTDRTFVTATFRSSPSLTSYVTSGIGASMQGINATAYLRIPFNVTDPAIFNVLTLRMKYDDGFAAFLNGVEVARINAPMTLAWNSSAAGERPDAENNEWSEWNLTSSLGLLRAGANVLAIQGLNLSASDSDFLILPELTAATVIHDTGSPRYFTLPTPGSANGAGNTNLGPLILSASHTPNVPLDNENLIVTATASPTFYPVSGLSLIYRVMFSNEVTAPMFDDGQHGDGAAGDGTWGATIPASASNPGQMVRYYVFATDNRANSSRFPSFLEPKNSPQYQGTVVVNPTLTNPLPVMHFFVQDTVGATNFAGVRGSIFWGDEFFDNIEVSAHGQTTWFVFPKRSMNFNLNTGHKLRPREGASRVKAFDLLTTAADKAYLRMSLGFETFRNAGVPTHDAFPVRLQQNNAFHSVVHFVEQANEDFLERNGLSPNGALYKIYLQLTDAYTGAKKVTRKNEPNDDLQALIDGLDLNQTETAFRQYLFDNVDIPEVVNFMATIQHVQNEDCCGKNFYLYRDTEGNGEWQMLPWDLDLTFGRTFVAWTSVGGITYGGYYDTNLYATNLYYSQNRSTFDFIGVGTHLPNAILSFPDTLAMFYRRWSTIQEEMLQKSTTHPLALKLERRVDEYAAMIGPDAVLDLQKWQPLNPPGFIPPGQTLPQAVSLLKTRYLAPRRPWIFNQLAFASGGPYVGTQPSNAVIKFGSIEYNPSSGNQKQEYIQLLNTNNYSVDLTGWRIAGAIDYAFKPGVVIPSNGVLYVSPDVNAFRARTTGPRGGQGLFVQGNYQGALSARGETLQLVNASGNPVVSTNTPGTPSLAQQFLRITELMYHPAPPPPGMVALADEFEFIELKNIGPSTLSLIGVRLTNGVEFNFTGSAVTNLASGASVLVVRNQAAFVSRYGGGLPVAGQFAGTFDNNGETIRLEDAAGEKILEFAYNNAWYPITDGEGFSLVIVNEAALWSTWGLKESWRPSSRERGSPGLNNPPLDAVAPIVINELTTHTVPPAVDTIELYNPAGTNVNIGGWFLTDDFLSPRKYRISDNTFITAGGYLVFNESQFNPTNPPSPTGFAFSSKGDEVYLFSATVAGDLTGYYHGHNFDAGAAGVSFGRYVNSVSAEHFVAQNATTFPGANSVPKVGPVIVSEIHYRPPDYADGTDNSDDEFIELRNITGAGVPLFEATFTTNTWHLRGNVDFDFPQGVTLGANGLLLVVNFNPSDAARLAAFRSQFNVPVGVPVFGPYGGKLDNSSGSVKLYKPDLPLAGETPQILVDEVDYSQAAPWPPAADGNGPSLQRIIATQYGNDPINWTAAAPNAGGAFAAGTGPVITMQPTNRTGLAAAPVTFTVAATGTAPLAYQWHFNGLTIAGANGSSFTINYVLPEHAGLYGVTVFNGTSAVESSNALLSVVLGPFFTQNPTNYSVRAGNTATFVAAAAGTPPVTYQWKLNGTNALGIVTTTSSNSTLTIANAQVAAHAGVYTVLATDSAGTVPSTAATLSFLVDPTITLQPLGQSMIAGGSATFSVAVTNTATLPIGYRWRRNGAGIVGGFFVLNEYTNYFTVTNVQAPLTNYTVNVTNLSRPSGFFSTSALLFLLPDTDGDGVPDSWEIQFGFNQNNPFDGTNDLDGDGMSNWAEYIAGTNPTNDLSYLKAEPPVVGAGALVSFGAISNRTYTVQYTDAIGTGAWFKLGDVPARANNRVESFNDPSSTSNRYYRVSTPRQP